MKFLTPVIFTTGGEKQKEV